MPSPTSVAEPRVAMALGSACAGPTPSGTAVLDRVATRVRQRLELERAATNRGGGGAHAASLIWPWPL
ncbi:HaaA family cyclophane-containing RiPP peptide [Streptomyces sp. PTD9-10]|uniref:HaaA family cyclophane-containing RiPP peptide n=1 Tax=Streptomyces sp. PTD9-10 TaxID=3120151 RepID=UPI0030091FBB